MAQTEQLRSGHRYKFRGLPGQVSDDRTMEVSAISVGGEVQFVIEMTSGAKPREACTQHLCPKCC